MFKLLIIFNLLLILISLFSGVIFLVKDTKKGQQRLVTSLTIRIALSITLLLLLLVGYYTGQIAPHAVGG